MSGLAALLGGDVPPGVYEWDSNLSWETLQKSIAVSSWQAAYVSGWTVSTKAESLAKLAEALGFPSHFGGNFDALADCLRDVATTQPTVLLWDGWAPFALTDPVNFDVLLEVFRQRCAEQTRPFAVILRGEGPALAVPRLD